MAVEKELEEVKSKWQQTQQELETTKFQLHDVREELERSQSQLDEVLGELEPTHFELHQLKETGEAKQSESESELQKELEETKSKLQETEQLLEQSQSQLSETMEVWEEYQYQMDQIMATLEESQGKLQQKQEELEQVKAELAQKGSESESELQKELEETKSQLQESEQLLQQYQSQLEQTMGVLEQSQAKLQQKQKELEETKSRMKETEELLEQSPSQLQETMEVLEESHSQIEPTMEMLEASQAQLQQKESDLKLEVEKTEQLSRQSDAENRLFRIENAIVKPIQIRGGKWLGGVLFPNDMPEIFRHRRSGGPGKAPVYKDQPREINQHNHLGSNNTGDRQIDNSVGGTYIYGGPFYPHFGHALTESIHRLWAFDSSVHDGIVFAVSIRANTNLTNYTPPQWFIQILKILEIPLGKCIWVTHDCTFQNLIIPEPGSELSLGPKKWYRSYLEKLQQRIWELTSHLRIDKPEKLFLGRTHIRFSGNIAGSEFFETLLVDEGYVSLKPENYDVLEQLAYIINAQKIIFSEGSAIHILELMNYLDTEIACIPRRATNKAFYPHIHSKCSNYVITGNIDDVVPLGNWEKEGIKSTPINKHPDKIIESLRKHNFASLKNWDENKFLAAEKNCIMTYIKRVGTFLPNCSPAHRAGIMEKYLQIRGTIEDNSTSQIYCSKYAHKKPKRSPQQARQS